MSELVVQLRKEIARSIPDKKGRECCYAPWTCCDPRLLEQAADEIERLRAENEQLRSNFNTIAKYAPGKDAEAVQSLTFENAALRASNADLLAALKLFIKPHGRAAYDNARAAIETKG